MLSNEKAMYQAYLIIESLPENEKKLIPADKIEKLKNNMEIDEKIKINPSISLTKQKIDDKTLKILDYILKNVDIDESDLKNNLVETNIEKDVIDIKRISELLTENHILNEKIKNIECNNQKLEDYREIASKFKDVLEILNNEKEKLLEKLEKIRKVYEELPSFVKKIFLKNKKVNLLASENK